MKKRLYKKAVKQNPESKLRKRRKSNFHSYQITTFRNLFRKLATSVWSEIVQQQEADAPAYELIIRFDKTHSILQLRETPPVWPMASVRRMISNYTPCHKPEEKKVIPLSISVSYFGGGKDLIRHHLILMRDQLRTSSRRES